MSNLRLISQCLIAFVANSIAVIANFTNGCGNYFALGTPYGNKLQECESFLQKNYGIDYFSESSPVIFDDLFVVLLFDFVLFLFFRRQGPMNGIHTMAFWVSALLGLIAPLVAIRFLQ